MRHPIFGWHQPRNRHEAAVFDYMAMCIEAETPMAELYAEMAKRDKARSIMGSAIKSLRLLRQPCEHCTNGYPIEGHHVDYDRPLQVVWLCKKCHKKLHQEHWEAKYNLYELFALATGFVEQHRKAA